MTSQPGPSVYLSRSLEKWKLILSGDPSEGNGIACCGSKRSSHVNMVNVLPVLTGGWEDEEEEQDIPKC